MTTSIFIDGEAGTTGLQIRERLSARSDIDLISLPDHQRKTFKARENALNSADIVILCLPDQSAREAVSMVKNKNTRIIDASSAHRISKGWTYGFPEYDSFQAEKIANALRVTNPGCYAIGSISILHPLVSSGLLPPEEPITINAISGYSGGGRKMIEEFEDNFNPNFTEEVFRVYSLSLQHKHISEIQKLSGLLRRPLFVPSVGRYRQGMIIQIPLQLFAIPGKPTAENIYSALKEHYNGRQFFSVLPLTKTRALASIQPELLNNTNEMHIFVFSNTDEEQALIVGLFDNLGKGAAGQVIQNLNIMLGYDETKNLLKKTKYKL